MESGEKRRHVRRLAIVSALVCAVFVGGTAAWGAPARLSLRLDSPLSALDAPYYLALSRGWYASAGLELSIVAGTDQSAAASAVDSGSADLGVADATTVLALRGRGMKLRVIATVGDRHPAATYFISGGGISKPGDLAGKKVAVGLFDLTRILFPLFADKVGVRVGDVTFQAMDMPAALNALSAGSADALFSTLRQDRALAKAIGADRLGRFLWADSGFDLYGQCLFAREDSVKNKAAPIRAFLAAAFKAWELALRNPDQAAAALAKYRVITADGQSDLAVELSSLLPLFDTPVYQSKGIGFIDSKRMAATADAVQRLFGIPLGGAAAQAMTADLLPKPPVRMPVKKPPSP